MVAAAALTLLLLAAAVGPASASAQGMKIGKVSRAASGPGGGMLLVPVRYRLEHSGRVVAGRVTLRGPGGLDIRRSLRTRLNSGPLRYPDLRREFRFVHAVPVGSRLAGVLARNGSRIAARVSLGAAPVRPGGSVTRSVSRQRGIPGAPKRLCSSVPLHDLDPSAHGFRAPAPRCGAPIRWSVAGQPGSGHLRVKGPWLHGRSGWEGTPSDSVRLVGRIGRRPVARQTVRVRTLPLLREPVSVVALGDSVTAGFGYYGSSGREMSITKLFDCRPGEVTYNDACSSNSSNTTNAGTPLNFLPDFGLARNISWPAQWANRHGITNYRNFAVSGSAPADWLVGGQFAWLTERVKAINPDYVAMTIGANPLLSDMLFGFDNMKCAYDSPSLDEYRQCIEKEFASVRLAERLNALYSEIVEATDSQLIVMQYHLSIPASALAYSAVQIEVMGQMLNQVIAEQAAAVSADRIAVVSPPRFFVGIDMSPLYPSTYSCSRLGYRVDGRSVQSTPTQAQLLVAHPLSFCSGPEQGAPWVISGDTGIHPSATGYARMANRLPAP